MVGEKYLQMDLAASLPPASVSGSCKESVASEDHPRAATGEGTALAPPLAPAFH